MAYRVERVEKIIERSLADIIFTEVHNELIKYVSITKVSLNKDMSVAIVWYTVFGSDSQKEASMKALEEAKGFLRTELAHRLDLRKMPELTFKYDSSFAYGEHIEEILKNIKK